MSESELSEVEYDERVKEEDVDEVEDEEDEGEEDDDDEEEEDYQDFEQDEYQAESSDNDFNIDDGDDDMAENNYEQEATPKPKKVNLKLKLTKSSDKPKRTKAVIIDDEDDDDDEEEPVKRAKRAVVIKQDEKKLKKAPTRTGSTRRAAQRVSYADDFNEEDLLEDGEELPDSEKIANNRARSNYSYDDEDTIPTPALDTPGLSDDDDDELMGSTNDVTKMTERQRARLLDGNKVEDDNTHLSLSNDIQKRRVLTEEENALRRAEIARKRKNLSEKKLEEEKQDTINKLLRRRAGKASGQKDDEEEDGSILDKPRRPQFSHPALFTWVSKAESISLRVPEPFHKT